LKLADGEGRFIKFGASVELGKRITAQIQDGSDFIMTVYEPDNKYLSELVVPASIQLIVRKYKKPNKLPLLIWAYLKEYQLWSPISPLNGLEPFKARPCYLNDFSAADHLDQSDQNLDSQSRNATSGVCLGKLGTNQRASSGGASFDVYQF
jgi:hypothetical protein